MKPINFFLLFFLLHCFAFAQYVPAFSPDSLSKHVFTLASDEFQGRNTGEEGQKKAAAYIAGYFHQFGLIPAGNNERNPYYQQFILYSNYIFVQFPYFRSSQSSGFKPASSNILYFGSKKNIKQQTYETICSSPSECCNDTSVFVFLKIPDIKSAFDTIETLKQTCSNKKFMILLPDESFSPIAMQWLSGNEIFLFYHNQTWKRFALDATSMNTVLKETPSEHIAPVFSFIERHGDMELMLVNEYFLKSKGYDTEKDNFLQNITFQVYKIALNDTVWTENVVGYIDGKMHTDKVVVIGAHYDHVGHHKNEIFNGADDNASGTALLIELARHFSIASKEKQPLHSILFIAFTAEEKGLYGSQVYVENPTFPISSTIAMLNMDMVGRPQQKSPRKNMVFFLAYGPESKTLKKIIRKVDKSEKNIRIYQHPGLINKLSWKYGSDHHSFIKKGIPAGVFFTGMHEDYHKPTDTAEKINYQNMAAIGTIVYKATAILAGID